MASTSNKQIEQQVVKLIHGHDSDNNLTGKLITQKSIKLISQLGAHKYEWSHTYIVYKYRYQLYIHMSGHIHTYIVYKYRYQLYIHMSGHIHTDIVY